MSECVVRMEMPQNGVCDGCGAKFVDSLAGSVCAISKKFLGSSRPSWCPIICSLPEGHGRLGDLDELGRKINGARIRVMQGGQDTNPYWECGDIIASEKTIIPAERSKI